MAESKSNLDDIKKTLEEGQKDTKDTNKAIGDLNKSIKDFMSDISLEKQRDALDQTEKDRESKNYDTRRGLFDGLKGNFSKAFGGTQFADTIGSVIAGAGAIVGRLLAIGKLFLASGAIGGLIYLMYQTFKDIGENEKFQAALEKIKSTWNDKIVPTWLHIKELFSNFLDTELFGVVLSSLAVSWPITMESFKAAAQGFVSDMIVNLTNTLSGVLQGIEQIFNGDFFTGVFTIGKSLAMGVKDFWFSAINSVLTLVGIDLGPGGLEGWMAEKWQTFTAFLRNGWNDMVINSILWVTDKINMVRDFISEKWTDLTNNIKLKITNLKETITGTWTDLVERVTTKFGELKEAGQEKLENIRGSVNGFLESLVNGIMNIKDVMVATFNYYVTKITNTFKIAFEGVTTWIANLGDKLYLLLAENLKFKFPEISVPLPQWLGGGNFVLVPGFEMGVGNQETISARQNRIETRNQERDDKISALNAETANALKALNDAIEELKQNGAQQNIVVAPSQSLSNYNQNQTNFSVHPSSVDRVGPL